MSLQIRQLTIADVDDYIDFLTDCQCMMAMETEKLELDRQIVFHGIKRVFENNQLGHYYVAMKNQTPVACLLTTYEWSDWRCKLVLWIQSVFVTPENRGTGIYKSMYQHIQNVVNENNEFAGIRLYVDKTNHQAIEVYQKLGMTREHYHLYEWMNP